LFVITSSLLMVSYGFIETGKWYINNRKIGGDDSDQIKYTPYLNVYFL